MVIPINLEHLPFPVAYPLAHSRDENLSFSERIDNTLFASYQAMRITGLVLLADYFNCDAVNPHLANAIRGLRMPHWGEWSILCNKLVSFWNGQLEGEKPERPSYFAPLVKGWHAMSHKTAVRPPEWADALKGMPGPDGPAWSPHHALWKARNDRAHRTATRTTARSADESLLARLRPLVELEVEALFPYGALTLVRAIAKDPLRVIRLIGPHTDLRFEEESFGAEWSGLFQRNAVAALSTTNGVALHPLVVSIDGEWNGVHAASGLTEPVGLLEGCNSKRIAVLGVDGWGERPDLVIPFMEALASKKSDFGLGREATKPWTMADWAEVTALETLESLRGRKYFPECYLDRPKIDGTLKACLENGGRGILLLGEAGSGKSSLLARFAEGLLRSNRTEYSPKSRPEVRDVVLYLSGRSAYSGDVGKAGRELLCEAVLSRAGVRSGAYFDLTDFATDLSKSIKEDTEEGRRVWLILDGLNEADRFTDLLTALDAFLPTLETFPWLRLLISIRSGAWESLASRNRELARHGGVIDNARFLWSFPDARSKGDQPYLEIPIFDKETEGRPAYELRQATQPQRASSVPYDRLSPAIKTLLLSPLHLHIFHETYRGRDQVPANLDESDLLNAYLDDLLKELPYLADTLRNIGKVMFETHSPVLPADTADTWIEAWRKSNGFQSAACVCKLDPIEELVSASLILRPAEEGVGVDRKLVSFQFSHQKLCEQVLLRHLMATIAPRILPYGEELLAWARYAASEPGFPELIGSLVILSRKLAVAGQGVPLAALMDLEDDKVHADILGAGIRALGPIWGAFETKSNLAASVLHTIQDVALNQPPAYRKRFLELCMWEGDWLLRAGYRGASRALSEMRLQVARAQIMAEPQRSDIQKELMITLVDLARLAVHEGRGADARQLFIEGVQMARGLVMSEPDRTDLKQYLATVLGIYGKLALKEGREGEAQELMVEGLELGRNLVKANPDLGYLQRGLAMSLNALGILMKDETRNQEAGKYFEESLQILRNLLNTDPLLSGIESLLAETLGHLSVLRKSEGKLEEALRFREENVLIWRKLSTAEPHDTEWRESLANSLHFLGVIVQGDKRIEDARRFFDEAIQITRDLVVSQPFRLGLKRGLSSFLKSLAKLNQSDGRNNDALRLFEERLQLRRSMVKVEPHLEDLQKTLAASLNDLGQHYTSQGNEEAAKPYFDEALDIFQTLLKNETTQTELILEIANCHWNIFSVSKGHIDQVNQLELVIENLLLLREAGIQNSQITDLWIRASKAIEDRHR